MDRLPADLDDLACAVADGVVVDWDAAAAAALTPVDRDRIRRMRLLATVAAVHAEAARRAPRGEFPLAGSRPDTSRGEDAPDYSPGAHWGGLQIIDRIGGGTSGQVYRARDPRLDREVALKLLHDTDGTSDADPSTVVREARLLARVRHPNVATVFGASHASGRVGIWMELVDGHTLEEEARQSGPMSADAATAIGRDLCRALGAVHRAGLLHRDIKAQNVMRDRHDGRIVLTDFSAGRERTDRLVTEGALPGTLAGSPLYLAPEILVGTPASERSDLYGLGVLLFRVLTGRFPVEGESLGAIRAAHAANGRLRLSALRADLPERLTAAVERALSPDPAARFASAGEMETALGRAEDDAVPRAAPTVRRRLVPALVLVATAVALAGAALAVRSRSPARAAITPFAERDWALVADFENRSGDPRFDGVLERALQRELAGSGFVNVVSRARVEDALALMRKPPDSPIDGRVATEVALRDGGIRALLTGRIDRVGNAFSLTTNVVNPADGVIVASISGDVTEASTVLPEVRAQALRVREALGETLPSIARRRETLARVATPSLAALQLYSRAATLLNGDYWLDLDPLRLASSRATAPAASRYDSAEALLREATQADPAFASAWLLLAHVVWNRTFPRTDYLPFVDRALQQVDTVEPAERYFIQGFAEWRRSYVDGDREAHLAAAVRAYEGLLQLRPEHDWGLRELGAIYRELGRNDDAERLTFRALSVRPHSFHFAVEAAKAHLRRRDRSALAAAATRLLASPLSTEPQTVGKLAQNAAWIRLWAVHDAWLDADVSRALQEADAADRKWSWDSSRWWLLHLVEVYIGLGRFGDARRVAARMDPEYRDWALALVATFREDAREFRRLVDPVRHQFSVLHNRSGMLTMNGWLATTEWVLAERRRRHVAVAWVEADFDAGLLAVARHQYGEARALLEPLTRSSWSTNSVALAYDALAVAYTSAGNPESAIALLEPLGDARAAAVSSQWRVYDWLRCRVLLAELYQSSGRHDDALRLAAEIRRLLGVSDADHPLLRRVARLEASGRR